MALQEITKAPPYSVFPWLLFHLRLDTGRTHNHAYLMVPEEHNPLPPFLALLMVRYESQSLWLRLHDDVWWLGRAYL